MGTRTQRLRPVFHLVVMTAVAVPLAAQEKSPQHHDAAENSASAIDTPKPSAGGLALADLEQIALQNNPTLVQAESQIGISQGKALQAGLYPNPMLGYDGEQMGLRDAAGGERQGAFLQQEIVTAGKLKISRAKYCEETTQAEVELTGLLLVDGLTGPAAPPPQGHREATPKPR